MTEPPDDAMDERLRAILRAEAGSVDPSPEALNTIRARTQRGGRFAALLNAQWLRPSLAVGAAVLIVGSVLLGAPQVREQILPQSLTTPAGGGKTSYDDGGGRPGGDGEDSASVEAPPEPGPADHPTGGAAPTSDSAEAEDTDDSANPFGTTADCPAGSSPVPTTASSSSEDDDEDEAGSEDDTSDTGVECEPTDDASSGDDDDPPDEDTSEPPDSGDGGDGEGDGDSPSSDPDNESSDDGDDSDSGSD